jgi:hypothetical protein
VVVPMRSVVQVTDEEYQKLYVEWAREKYHDPDIEDVVFSLGTHGPYSDQTPDVESFVSVWVKRKNPQPFGLGGQVHEESDVHALIRELNEFIDKKRGRT